MTSRTIRRATTEDIPALTKIRNDSHAKKVAHGDYAWGGEGDGFSESWVRNHVARRGVYVVEIDDTPVGTLTLDLADENHWGRQEPIAGYVHGLCVRDGFNRLGLGAFMLDWCAHALKDMNRRFVRLDCALDNTKLCAYYESLGFVRVGQKTDGHVWALYERPVD